MVVFSDDVNYDGGGGSVVVVGEKEMVVVCLNFFLTMVVGDSE